MITIVDTGGANINSILFCLKRIGVDFRFARSVEDIRSARKILLPGVGAAKNAMLKLKEQNFVDAIKSTKVDVLGICLGMQILYENSDEGDVKCLGVIPGNIRKIKNTGLSLPHMGWNKLVESRASTFSFCEGKYVYFVHSYRADMNDSVTLYADYGENIPAIVQRDNFYGTQFHPEKSADIGEEILRRFLEL